MFDIVQYLSANYKIDWANSTNISIQCPWCLKESKHFTISVDKPTFNCYRCGESGSWVRLIAFIENISYQEAYKIIYGYVSYDLKTEEIKKEIKKISLPKLSNFSEDAINILRKRNVSDDIIKKFDISYTRSGFHKNRIVFPITKDNEVWTFQSRQVYEDKKPKYMAPKNSPLGQLLYGYDQMYDSDKVVVVEGIFDHLNLYRDHVNVVASFGKKISQQQIEMLHCRNIQKVILMYDSDALKKIESLWYELGHQFKTYMCPLFQGDPGDLKSPIDYIEQNIVKDFKQMDELKEKHYFKGD
jgi:DNA primase